MRTAGGDHLVERGVWVTRRLVSERGNTTGTIRGSNHQQKPKTALLLRKEPLRLSITPMRTTGGDHPAKRSHMAGTGAAQVLVSKCLYTRGAIKRITHEQKPKTAHLKSH